jgi:tetratricopeptide (TPR) repeat protein
MIARFAFLAAAALLASAPGRAADMPAPPAAEEQTAPVPPVPPAPPRLADSEDYGHCLRMVADDPSGAFAFADAWYATGGAAPAQHCQALAEIALGDPQSGAALIEQAVAASTAPPGARAAVLGQAIQAWIMADDPARAYDAATKAIELAPEEVELWIDRSIAAATMERYFDAIDDLDRALALDPERADALVMRAAAWRNEQKLDRAKADVDRAIGLDPDNPEALLERGIQRQRAGDADGARADWLRARDLAPDTATADLAEQNLALLEAGPVTR